jgi:hypothetical protein
MFTSCFRNDPKVGTHEPRGAYHDGGPARES